MPTPIYQPTNLDPGQVLKYAFDETTQRLRVDAEVTATISGAQEVIIAHTEDSIKIGDGVDFLAVNADGSINVNAAFTEAAGETEILEYNEILSVASAVETTILTYTVPLAKTLYLHRVEVAGTNIAEYKVKVNSNVKAKKYTYFGAQLNNDFDFTAGTRRGYEVPGGAVITVTTLHNRSSVGNFNARLQGLEVS